MCAVLAGLLSSSSSDSVSLLLIRLHMRQGDCFQAQGLDARGSAPMNEFLDVLAKPTPPKQRSCNLYGAVEPTRWGRVGDAFGASCERRRADRPARRLHSSGSANGEPRVSALLRRCVVSYSDKRGLIAKRAAVRRSFLFGVCCRSYFGAWIANEVAAGARSRDIAAGRRPLGKPKASRRPRTSRRHLA